MKTPLDNDLNKVYESFNQNHNHLRQTLMASLPDSTKKLKRAGRISHALAFTGGTIMRSRITKIAVAAVIIIAVVLSITFLDKSVTPAYAIEQTVEASHSIRFVHIKDFAPSGEQHAEFWLEFDESGQPLNARMDFPDTQDGPKVSVLNQNTGHVWFKAKNFLVTVRDRDDIVAKQLLNMAIAFDPKHSVEKLRLAEAKGSTKIEITEPTSKSESIIITAIYLLKNGEPSGRDVLAVDPETKLVTKWQRYNLVNGEYKPAGLMEFLNYNEKIDPEMFTINAPDDVIRIDQTTQQIGLPKGDLSDNEIAVKVACQFFEALIAKDYSSAGKLLEGMPADWIKQQFGKTTFLRVVSIGEPTPHANPATRFLCVPCKIEIETEKGKSVKEFVPNIRPVYSKPNRWTIGGGIP